MIWLYLILFLLLVYFIFFISQFFNIIFHNYPPFISSSYENLKKIISEIKIKDSDTVYELGCGRARFLRLIERSFPKAQLIGVENLFSIYIINKLRLKLQGSRLKLLNNDLFNLDLSKANIIYCYLNNTTMIKLGEKIIKECQPGTQIISQTFSLPQLTAKKTIIENNKKINFYIL